MNKVVILLVDDEKSILKALRRTLFEYPYEIVIVSSSFEAKQFLSGNRIDMIISDYKMPDENGFKLLSFVRDNYPEVIRIMLSGYVEKEVVLETMFSCAAVTFFPKPWDDEKLLSRIVELIEIKKNIVDTDLWCKINSGVFFSMTSVISKKLNLISENKSHNEELGKIISTDIFLLFRVVRLVNSDYFNFRSDFDLNKAINIIGAENILKLSEKISISDYSIPSPYSIMADLFLSYYDTVFKSTYGQNKPEPLTVYLPFIYLYNYLLFQIDMGLYNKQMKTLVDNGVPFKSPNSVREIFKTIVNLCRLPEEFLDFSDKVEMDSSPSIRAAGQLRNLIELFWWSDNMPVDHPFYTIPGEILESIYTDVQELKKLQL